MTKRIWAVFILMMLSMPAGAEDVVLKNGMTVQGQIVDRSNKWIRVLSNNVEVTYYFDEILEIDGLKPEPVSALNDGGGQVPLFTVQSEAVASSADQSGRVFSRTKVISGPNEESRTNDPATVNVTAERTQTIVFQDNTGVRSKVRKIPVKAQFYIIIGMAVILTVVFLFCYPVYLIAKRTNTANPIFAFIPIMNYYLVCKIAGRPVWWMILYLVPLVNYIIDIIVWADIAKVRIKPAWLGVLTIVPLANAGMMWYLAVAE